VCSSDLTQHVTLPPRAEMIIRQLTERDCTKAAILRKYFIEMKSVLAEMYRVLRSSSAANRRGPVCDARP